MVQKIEPEIVRSAEILIAARYLAQWMSRLFNNASARATDPASGR
jgi:hypothetical protein